MPNALYYGDNLPIMREYLDDESVDLVYLDPPFNSNASYNVLFKEQSGERSPAQIKAFTDTWEWTEEAERTYEQEVILNPAVPGNVKEMISAFRRFIGANTMMAYLVMMTPRLVELRRILKSTGSIYLHCDPTASHYIKILMDTVFGSENYQSEITWQRTSSHNDSKRFGQVRDIILFYSKSNDRIWNPVYVPHDESYVSNFYRHEDDRGKYRLHEIIRTASMGPRPNLAYEYKGYLPEWGWRMEREKLKALDEEGRLVWSSTGRPYRKTYLPPGQIPTNLWADIGNVSAQARERLGYPTQKPLALLERIIKASSNEGCVVLDPFCGCGTTVEAAEKLGRRWIGIDITHLAVAIMKNRLRTAFNIAPRKDYEVVGEPVDAGSARALAEQDRYQFQYWAVSLLEGSPRDHRKRGADRGVDGVIYFIDGPRHSTKKAVIQVKSGKVSSPDIRDLKGVAEREKAALGLFITLEEPTREMRREAAAAGFHHSDLWQQDYSRIQIRTIEDLLTGKNFDLPPHPSMYKAAPRVQRPEGRQVALEDTES